MLDLRHKQWQHKIKRIYTGLKRFWGIPCPEYNLQVSHLAFICLRKEVLSVCQYVLDQIFIYKKTV